MREKRRRSGSSRGEESKRIIKIDNNSDNNQIRQNDDLATEELEPNWINSLQKLPEDFRAVSDAASELAEGFRRLQTAIIDIQQVQSNSEVVSQFLNLMPQSLDFLQENNQEINSENERRHKHQQSETKPIIIKKPSNSKSKSTEIKEIEKDILPYEERTAINDKLIAYYNRRERITDMNRTELIQELTDCAVNKDVGVNLAANLQKYLIRKYIPKHPFLIRAIQKWVKKEIKIRGEIPMD
ncbi:2453_t:CDS:2 [Ambispora leptoticha]|uniref:2453_t:CDS:1 n=1 Tax=Ambispora leptoticha TaxID=144679 RepID=A0A9N8Z526_9GLOM|nr:2453_t:CDS:2 [Ambispora leptoticha]